MSLRSLTSKSRFHTAEATGSYSNETTATDCPRELDVEALLNFSQHVLLNAARLWIEASVDQKQRLRKAIFPGGLSFSEGTFGTAHTSLVFQLIEAPITEKSDMVSPTGFSKGGTDPLGFRIDVRVLVA